MEQQSSQDVRKPEKSKPRQVILQISSILSEAEWKVLREFCDKAHRLMATKLATAGLGGIRARMSWEQGKGMWWETTLPPEEQVAEFVMAFRLFYLQKEPTHFPSVLSILGRHASESEVRQLFKKYRQQWENCLFGNALQIAMNEKQLTSSLVIDLWLNAHYFHSDEDKKAELDQIFEGLSGDFAKYMLLDSVFEASKMILKIHRAVCAIIEKRFNAQCPYRKEQN